jgi:MFS family permease
MKTHTAFLAFVVSLGGFLFGFDAGIISGVMNYFGPQFDLSDGQAGWVVSSPTFSATFAMLIAGRLSDMIGRKPLLLGIALLYTLSAVASAYANSFEVMFIARMIGGAAFGAALIIAPTYIAEIATARNRGKLVSIQQLNIVLGFFAAFACNNFLRGLTKGENALLSDETVWRWMLGVEAFPAALYFLLMLLVPESPRWLFTKNRAEEGRKILGRLHGEEAGAVESAAIRESINRERSLEKGAFSELFSRALAFIVFVGIAIGILQQSTGINAVYFYATGIFKQTGIGTDAAFTSGVLLSTISVVFTIVAMVLIDRVGRRPLLLVGIGGIAVSLLMCAWGFSQATYQLTSDDIAALDVPELAKLSEVEGEVFTSDVAFKDKMKELLGSQVYGLNEGPILEAAIENMPATIVLVGIFGFIACFAFSLGPVMWVMLSELYPNRIRGLAIGVIGFVNSATSWVVQQVFPWELSVLGNATSFLIFGLIAAVGFFLFLKILPETKGKSLEELEAELIKT